MVKSRCPYRRAPRHLADIYYIVLHRIGGSIPAPYIALYLPNVTIAAMPFFVMGTMAGKRLIFVICDLACSMSKYYRVNWAKRLDWFWLVSAIRRGEYQ